MTPPHIEAAARAHTRLTMFYAIIELAEGGTMPGGGSESANKTVARIVKLCKEEAQRQLIIYDTSRAAIRALSVEG